MKFIDRSSGKVPGSKPDKHPSSMEIGATSSPCATGGVAVVGDFFDRGGGVCHDFHLLCSVEVIAVIWFLDRGVKPQLPNRSSRHRSDDTSLRFYTGFISRNDELQWISTRSSTICPTKHRGCYPTNRHEWRCCNRRASQS